MANRFPEINWSIMKKVCFLFLTTLLLSVSTAATTNTPGFITFQGTMSTATGGLVEGNREINIAITEGRNGRKTYEKLNVSTLFVNGSCSVVIGPLTTGQLDIPNPHLQITLDGLSASFPILSTAYSIHSRLADTVKAVDASTISGVFTSTVNINNNLFVRNNVLTVVSGNVGIGTRTPAYPLDIVGDVNATGFKVNGRDIESVLSWQKNGNNIYYTQGRVGIATTNPSTLLDIAGTLNAREYRLNGVELSRALANEFAWKPAIREGDIFFNDGRPNSSGRIVGSVGIGTNDPQARLDVRGEIKIGEAAFAPTLGAMQYVNDDFLGYTPDGWVSLIGLQGQGNANQITFWRNASSLSGSDNLVWDFTNQRMGIGTANPTAQLSVRSVSDNRAIVNITDRNNKSVLFISSKNIGIGTTTPNVALKVKGIVDADNYFLNGVPIAAALRSSSLWNFQNDGRIFYSNGNVGIGTTQPRNLLELASSPSVNPVITFDLKDVNLFSMGIDSRTPSAFILSQGGDLTRPIFVFKEEKIGVGLSNPSANLQVSGNSGVLFTGQFGTNDQVQASGPGTRLMWIPSKAAFRAGHVVNTQWDHPNIGNYSVAMGYNVTANGIASTVVGGYENWARGDYSSVVGGFQNRALGDYSFAAGYKASANQRGTFVWADYSPTAPVQTFSSVERDQFIVRASNGVGINTNQTSGTSLTVSRKIPNEYIFRAIGNSSAPNALTITTSGNVGIGTSLPGTAKLAVIGGKVGIGTTSPIAPLSVSPNSTDQFVFVAYREDGNPAMFIRRDGRIAIGHALDFAFPNDVTVAVAGSFGGPTFKKVDPRNPSASVIIGGNAGSPWLVPSNNNNNTFFNRGKVGIGTSTPQSLLELSNANNIDPVMAFNVNNSNFFSMGVSRNKFTIQPTRGLTSNNPRFILDANGVGIGTGYRTPSATLHVNGDSILSGNVAIGTTNISTIFNVNVGGRLNTQQLFIDGVQYNPVPTPWLTGSSSEIYYNGGNVGIGTSTPRSRLEVLGTVSANNLVHSGSFTLNGRLQTTELHLKDTTSTTPQFGKVIVDDDELVYVDPSNRRKVLSSPLQRDRSTRNSGYLAHWSSEADIGVTNILWDRTKKSLDVSGNIDLTTNFSEPNGIKINSILAMGVPKGMSLTTTLNHSGDLRQVKSYTGEDISLNINQNWGNSNEIVTVKGMNLEMTQEDSRLLLNRARVVGLHVNVASINVNTAQRSSKAAAVFLGGNVGIGTESPREALEVNGTVSANFFNLTGGLFVPELSVNTNALVAYKDSLALKPRVGIGTTQPSTELEVIGTTSTNIMTITGGISATTLNVNSGALFVNSAGQVGIGTTQPNGQIEIKKTLTSSTNDPFIGEKMNILIDGAGTDQTFSFNQDIYGLKLDFASNTGSQIGSGKKTIGADINASNFVVANNNTLVGLNVDVTGTSGKRYAGIFNGGRVGIGVTQPLAELHVSGSILADNLFLNGTLESGRATFNRLTVNTLARFNGAVTINELTVLGRLTANTFVLETGLEAQDATFSTINAKSASINTLTKTRDLTVSQKLLANQATFTGGVGIATTAPSSGLAVNGLLQARNLLGTESLSLTSGTMNILSGTLFSAGGRIGIGTTQPQNLLHIRTSSGTEFDPSNIQTWNAVRIQNANNALNTVSSILFLVDTNNPSTNIGSAIGAIRTTGSPNEHGSSLFFVTDPISDVPTTRMLISSEGNVGIGTTSPQSMLHVNGNALFNEIVTVNTLATSLIRSSGELVIRPADTLVVEGFVSANQVIQVNNGLSFKHATRPPSPRSGFGTLYVDGRSNDLYFLKPSGASVNITRGFTGKAYGIPFFNSQGQLDDDTELYWNNTTKTFKIGTANVLTMVDHRVTVDNSVNQSLASEKLTMTFGNRTAASSSVFRGLQINLLGQNPTDPDNFGRLAQNETAIGLDVDLSTLRAERSTAQSTGGSLQGFKYAALFRGGSVGVGVSDPLASLHVVGDTAGRPAFRVDSTRRDSVLIPNALVVSSNGLVGIGLADPTAKLHIKANNDPLISDAEEAIFKITKTDNSPAFIVKNDGKIGIGTTNPLSDLTVSGNLFATTSSFNEIVATTLNIANGGLYVNAAGQVGFGTTQPQGHLSFAKTISPSTIPVNGFTSQKMLLNLNGGTDSLTFRLNRDITGMDIALESEATSQLGSNRTGRGLSLDLTKVALDNTSRAIGLFVDVTGTTGTRYAAILNGGRVGIGVTNPTVMLDVSGDIKATDLDLTGRLSAGQITANTLTVLNNSQFFGSITANNLVATTISANNITLSGLFRISTASITTLNANIATFNRLGIRVNVPRQPLDVSGNASISGGLLGVGITNPTAILHINTTTAASPFRVQIDNGATIPHAFVVSGNGRIGIATANPSAKLSISKASTDTDDLLLIEKSDTSPLMKITNSGLTGIGVASPLAQLHIKSPVNQSPLRIDNSANQPLFHIGSTGNIGVGISSPAAALHVSGNIPLIVGNATTPYSLFVNNAGSVGIGTSDLTYRFNVNGKMLMGSLGAITLPSWVDLNYNTGLISAKGNDYSIIGLERRQGSTTDYDSVIQWGSSTDDSLLFKNNSNQTIMKIEGSGKIGINTSTPTASLQVSGNTPLLIQSATRPFALIVSSNGNIGINTNRPSVELDVNGTIRARGFNVTHESLNASTVNITNALTMTRTVTRNVPITMQDIRLNLGADINNELVGLDIVLDSLPNSALGNARDYSLFNTQAYGLKVDMTGLQTQDPTLGGGNNGKKYAAAFLGGAVGIGITNPETTLQVVGPANGNIARFGSTLADLTIKDENNGSMLFSMRNLISGDNAFQQTLFLSGDKVGVGVDPLGDENAVKFVVNGDIRVGMKTSPSTAASGNRIYFSGGPDVHSTDDNDNNSPLWMGRNNVRENESEFLINAGNGDGLDRFIVGYTKNSTFRPVLQVVPSVNASNTLFRSRVGISDGSSTTFKPSTQLHVIGSTSGSASNVSSHLVAFENTGGEEADTLVIWHTGYGNAAAVPTGSNFITFADQTHILGEIEGSGDNGIRFKTNGADYAEYLPKINSSETIQKGDIVGVHNGKVSLRTSGASQVLVRSSAASIAGNWPGEEREKDHELIAFFGQVKVKVTGPINAGDYIIPSGLNDGAGIAIAKDAITPKEFSQIIGQAWQTNTNKEAKLVLAGVGFNFSTPKIGNYLDKITTLETRVKTLQDQQSKVETKFKSDFERQSKEIEALLKKLDRP